MIKKIIALVAGTAFSLNASAGYIRYDFSSGPVTGYFIQRDDNQAIATYKFQVPLPTAPNPATSFDFRPNFGADHFVYITSESTYFRKNGPTNFSVSMHVDLNQADVNLSFARATSGDFQYTAIYSGSLPYNNPNGGGLHYVQYSGEDTGLVTAGTVDASLVSWLDSQGGYDEFVTPATPTYIGPGNAVPEPGSFALLSLGALGAFRASRRPKKSSQRSQ